jgi:nucleotide-binding universal stress UspA family protein
LNILVPVSGTETSRRGAELAFAFAAAKDGKVTIIHAARQSEGEDSMATARRGRHQRKNMRAVVEDAIALAKRYNCREIRTAAHRGLAPDVAILKEAGRVRTDVIVIGANRRVGDALYLGETVQSVLRQWKGGIVLVAS